MTKLLTPTILLILLMSFFATSAIAHDIEVKNADGVTIYYKWINNKTELGVSYRGDECYSYTDRYSGNVVIPESVKYNGKTYSVTSISDYAFVTCKGLTSISIPKSVTSIGFSAFSNCSGLTEIIIPSNVFYIGYSAFSYCSNLTQIIIPSSVKYLLNAFSGCNKISKIVSGIVKPFVIREDVFTSEVYTNAKLFVPKGSKGLYQSTNFWNKFNYIEESEEIVVEKYLNRTIHVSKAGTLHDYISESDKYRIEELTLTGELNGTDFRFIRDMAGNNYLGELTGGSLTYLNLSAATIVSGGDKYLDTEEISTSPGGSILREYSYSIQTNEISQYLFCGCLSLQTLILPNSVTSIGGHAISYCQNLTMIVIPKSVTSIGDYAFYECDYLQSITIPATVSSIGRRAFIECPKLESIVVEEGNNNYVSVDGVLFNKSMTTLIQYPRGKTSTSYEIPSSVQIINELAFSYCNTLTYIGIPDGLNSIYYSSFAGCSSLNTLKLPNSLNYIGEYAFGNSGLTSITIPNSVTSIGERAFVYCHGLSSIISKIQRPFAIKRCFDDDTHTKATLTIPKGTKAAYQATEGWNKFVNIVENTSDLVVFAIEGINYEGSESDKTALVTSIDENMTSVTIPNRVTYNGVTYDVTSIGDRAFEGRSDIEYLSIPSSITSIGEYAFINCGRNITVNLESLEAWCNVNFYHEHSNPLSSSNALLINDVETRDLMIPKSVNKINTFSFFQCRSISTITIPNSVKFIDSSAFENCEGLTSVSLPNTLEVIGGSAFEKCTGLTTITLPASLTFIGKSAFNGCSSLNTINSMISNLFKIDDNTFSTYSSAKFTVPKGTKAAYQATEGWNKFVNIVEDSAADEIEFIIDGTTYQGFNSDNTALVKSVDPSLKIVEIPSSVRNRNNGLTYQVTSIADNAFKGCNLNYLSVPATITTLTEETFSGCSICSMSWNANTELSKKAFRKTTMSTDYNFLLYVNSADNAPQTVKNVIVGNMAETITLSDSGDGFYCPKAFTAKKISYAHHFGMETGGNGKGWETIALPFNVQKISHATRGEIVPFASYNGGSNQKPFWLASMVSSGFRSSSSIQANTPYIIAMPNSNKYQNEYNLAGDVTFSAENVSVPATPTFSGTFVPAYSTVTKSSNVHALNVVNKYVSNSGGYDAGSRFISNLRDVRPFEAYISQGSSTRGVIEIGFGDGTTGMGEVIGVYDADKVIDIHTLNGQKITQAKQGELDKVIDQLPRGVYIVNGKKIAK